MGTNVACMYATIYYSYHKETELRFLPYNRFYRRLIDDALIIVDENAPYEHLKNNMNNFGPIEKRLSWKTEKLSNTVNFLDLTLTIQEDRTITYKTYQKKRQLFPIPYPKFLPTSQHINKLCILHASTILPSEYIHHRL